jgi:hypothetical protein
MIAPGAQDLSDGLHDLAAALAVLMLIFEAAVVWIC